MRFFVRFRVETLASLAGALEQQQEGRRPIWGFSWPNEDARLVLYDALGSRDGVQVHEGLGLDLDVAAGSTDEALAKAQNLAEGLVNLLAYVSATACKPATLVSCHEIPEAPADVDVIWFYQERRLPLGDPRPVDKALLSSTFGLYDRADEATKWCISQAAQWLRKGTLELETIAQFVAYWVGLEAVSSKLLTLLGTDSAVLMPTCPSCRRQVQECPSCGSKLGRADDMAGVAKLLEQSAPDDKGTYRRIRDNRARLFHGKKKLKPEFLRALREDIPLLREALSRAIGACLGLDEIAVVRIARTRPRRALRPLTVKVLGQLVAFHVPDFGRPDLQPYVEHEPGEKFSVTAEGNLNVALSDTLTMRNASFVAREFETRGDEYAKAR